MTEDSGKTTSAEREDGAWDAALCQAFADQVHAAVGSGDPALMASVFHADMTVWENTDGVERKASDSQAFHHELARALRQLEITEPQLSVLPNGYVERHVKRFTLHDGRVFNVPSCLIVEMRDGRIAKALEYLDSAQLPPVVREIRSRHLASA